MAVVTELKKGTVDFAEYLQRSVRRETSSNGKRQEPLSKQFAGTLRLSDIEYEALQNSLQDGRSEWNRNIF